MPFTLSDRVEVELPHEHVLVEAGKTHPYEICDAWMQQHAPELLATLIAQYPGRTITNLQGKGIFVAYVDDRAGRG